MQARRTHRRSAVPAVGRLPAVGLLLLLLLLTAGCSYHYNRGQALEVQDRWEEAMIEYHLAVLEDPEDEDYRQAWEQAQQVVARDNFERYQQFLAEKEFRKAYQRLVDARRQDPTYEPVQEEMDKWLRVLVAGQVQFDFRSLQTNVQLADEIRLIARINTPNPGEVLEAEIDLQDGTFFAEDLLYDRPDELLTYYSLNTVAVELVHGRSRVRQFTSRELVRLVSYRTPVVDNVEGRLATRDEGEPRRVATHREALDDGPTLPDAYHPQSNPHYSLRLEGNHVLVRSETGRTDFTPRFMYLNRADRRLLVDFGRYEVKQAENLREWRVRRLPLRRNDYFPVFADNIALQPYFFYREGVYSFLPADAG